MPRLGLIAILILSACSNATSLKSDKSKKTQEPATERPKEEASGEQQTEAATVSASGNAVPEGTAVEKPVDDEDDDLRVIPPEVVSGAYLTCAVAPSIGATVVGSSNLGCGAVLEDGVTEVDIKGFKVKWSLLDTATKIPLLDILDVALPAGSRVQKIWRVPNVALEKGVKAYLELTGKDGVTATLRSRQQLIIDAQVQGQSNL